MRKGEGVLEIFEKNARELNLRRSDEIMHLFTKMLVLKDLGSHCVSRRPPTPLTLAVGGSHFWQGIGRIWQNLAAKNH